MGISQLLLRVALAFVVLFILARIIGRKEIGQMTFFNFVSAIAIGSIAASLAVDSSLSTRNGVIALAGWTAFTIGMGYLDIYSKKARKITTGEPNIVIKEGKVMENSLRSTRLDMDELNSLLRESGVFSITEVNYAIFEPSGKLSVMKKENHQQATKGDLNITPQVNVYPTATEVISDGIINTNNLARLKLDENWVNQQLQTAGIKDISEVFYAELQKDGSLYIDKKDDHMMH